MHLLEKICPSCALFLDFDGTLVDIAPQPEAVKVPVAMLHTLHALQRELGGALAVISGRPIAQLDAFLAPLKLPMAGVHGTERRNAQGELTLQPTYSLEHVWRAAEALAARHHELRVEHKRGSIALHYRQAPELEPQCRAAMEEAVAQSPGLSLLAGKMVLEAKPDGASKGLAIEAFLREPPFAGRVPVFVGDDVTDEVGFSAVQKGGGLGVKIGPGSTVAWQRLSGPAELYRELELALAAASRASALVDAAAHANANAGATASPPSEPTSKAEP